MADEMEYKVKVFLSYAHEDEELRDELEEHLGSLKYSGLIESWYDREIAAGTDWEQEIDRHLGDADIILLLVSPHFLNSRYCYQNEMKTAIKRHIKSEARVIPIALRPCHWKPAPFAKLQGLPKDMKPITRWEDRDEAFALVAEGIHRAIEDLIEHRKEQSPLTDEASQPVREKENPAITEASQPVREEEEPATKPPPDTQTTPTAVDSEDERRVDKLLEAIRPFQAKVNQIYILPDIPSQKLKNAVDNYEIPPDERIVALADDTIFGSAKNGFAFGLRGLYYHNSWTSAKPGKGNLSYRDFSNLDVNKMDSNNLKLNEDHILHFVSGFGYTIDSIKELLESIRSVVIPFF